MLRSHKRFTILLTIVLITSFVTLAIYVARQKLGMYSVFIDTRGIIPYIDIYMIHNDDNKGNDDNNEDGDVGINVFTAGGQTDDQMQTHDNWPYFFVFVTPHYTYGKITKTFERICDVSEAFFYFRLVFSCYSVTFLGKTTTSRIRHSSKNYFPKPIIKSPFHPDFTLKWNFSTKSFLKRPDVKGRPLKIITWMVGARYTPAMPEKVRMRVCPEMPCLMTTNKTFQKDSAALVWNAQIMRDPTPPLRAHADQVFVFHNSEPQKPDWTHLPSFRNPSWKSAFNWTMHYRFDSDFIARFAVIRKRRTTIPKNYTEILAKKRKLAAWIVSHCGTEGRREEYVKLLQKYVTVDVYGGCGPFKCPRHTDDACLDLVSSQYKFYLSFENAFCRDYISEKFFRYYDTNMVVVARGSNEYRLHAPPGTYINTADFNSTKALADHLLYLDSHPEEYLKILKAKDDYQSVYEDYPIRDGNGNIGYMEYHYEAIPFCEMCRRLWNLDKYKQVIPNIVEWFDKGNCYDVDDIK